MIGPEMGIARSLLFAEEGPQIVAMFSVRGGLEVPTEPAALTSTSKLRRLPTIPITPSVTARPTPTPAPRPNTFLKGRRFSCCAGGCGNGITGVGTHGW